MHNETMRAHFGRLARSYDELRFPSEEVTPEVEALVAVGDLHGRRMLDIGCGTGRILSILARYYAVQGWGIDPSPEMLAEAIAQVPQQVQVQVAAAEALPFLDRCFERAIMTLVVQHLDRPQAFSEAWRVLEPGGRLTIKTTDPATFECYWMARLFPSYARLERGRFPTASVLTEELAGAAFTRYSCIPRDFPRAFSKEMALRKLREGSVSTLVLLDEDELREGLARAERELPDPVEYTLSVLFVSAERPLAGSCPRTR